MSIETPLDMGEVLRRSHRDELLPLARALELRTEGQGRDALARQIERALRTAGALHPGRVLFLGKEPPPWHEVLNALARRRRVQPDKEPVETERRLLDAWKDGGASLEQRSAIERILSLPIPTPWNTDLGPRPALPTLRRPTVLLFLVWLLPFIFGPILALFHLRAWNVRRDAVLLSALIELGRLRALVQRRLVVVLVGPPSSGKDAAMKALFGLDTGGVHPVAGSTRTVVVYSAPSDPNVQLINTPGLGDVLQELTRETRDILDQADLFLFLVNAQGGVRQRELDEFSRVRQARRPVLVVLNKVDTLREADRERLRLDTAKKLRLRPEDVVATAFDPLPQLSETPIGTDAVHNWLSARLAELGRDPDVLRRLSRAGDHRA